MLAQLIRLEYIFNKRMLVFSGAMILALSVIYPIIIEEVSVSFAVGAIYLGFLPISLIARESKFQVDSAICSLPATRKEIVLGKYLFIGAVSAGLFVTFLCILIAVPYEGYTAKAVLRIDRIANAVLVIAIAGSLLIPLVIRYGYNGVMFFILGLNLLTVLLFIFTASGGAGDLLGFVFREIPGTFRSIRANLGTPLYVLVVAVIAFSVTGFSYRFSAWLYGRKEM